MRARHLLFSAIAGCCSVFFAGQVTAAQEDVPYCHRYMDFNFPDYMALWNYDDPQTTATTFFAMLDMAAVSVDKTFFSELLSQIARTYVMRNDFTQAEYYLAQAKAFLGNAEPRAEVYYLREKARMLAAQHDREGAKTLLVEAWTLAEKERYDQLVLETALDLADDTWVNLPEQEKQQWLEKARQTAATTQDERTKRWMLENPSRLQ